MPAWRSPRVVLLLLLVLLSFVALFSYHNGIPADLNELRTDLTSAYSSGQFLAAASLVSSSKLQAPKTVLPLSPSVAKLYDQVWTESPTPLDLVELRHLCERTTFSPDIYLRCSPPYAGLTTIMSQVKVCVRTAIETGFNLVMPVMAMRSEDDLKEFNQQNPDRHIPYGDWFEEETLLSRLASVCPNMKVARLNDKKEPALEVTQEVELDLKIAPYFNGVGNWAWPGRDWVTWYREEVARIIKNDTESRGLSDSASNGEKVVVVRAFAPLSFFNVMYDVSGRSLALWNEMNYLIRFKPIPRRIVQGILSHLEDDDTGVLQPYYGVHFRTEKDSPDAWIKADVQVKRILDMVETAWTAFSHDRESSSSSSSLSSPARKKIYLACGDTDRIAQFEQAANAIGWEVVDKYRLTQSIDPTLHTALTRMPFDHQGMIDLGVMMLSEFFVGLTNSAFSFSIAHARDPRGRFGGSTIENFFDVEGRVARTHLFDDGEGAYQCCL